MFYCAIGEKDLDGSLLRVFLGSSKSFTHHQKIVGDGSFRMSVHEHNKSAISNFIDVFRNISFLLDVPCITCIPK